MSQHFTINFNYNQQYIKYNVHVYVYVRGYFVKFNFLSGLTLVTKTLFFISYCCFHFCCSIWFSIENNVIVLV